MNQVDYINEKPWVDFRDTTKEAMGEKRCTGRNQCSILERGEYGSLSKCILNGRGEAQYW